MRFIEAQQQYEIQVKWLGFDYEELTQEPVAVMQEDIPAVLERFFQQHPDQKLVAAARDSLNY